MPETYPNDADGDAMRRVAGDNDMSKPMKVDFHIAAPDKAIAERIAGAAYNLGFRCSVYDSEDTTDWTCECSSRMLLTYDGVIAIQAELDALAKPLGGYLDGWGTLGNDAT